MSPENTQDLFEIVPVYQVAMNAAMLHNHVPPIREISITAHAGVDDLSSYQLLIENDLGAWPSWSTTIENLVADVPFILDKIPVRMEWDMLSGLTERQDGYFVVKLVRQSDNALCAEQRWPLCLMPIDMWLGVQVLPELLSSFVTPNIPAVQQLLQACTTELQRLSGNPSLDDYQSQDISRARMMMAAIYNTIKQAQIVYATVPASFEQQGQRVRMPDVVVNQRMGNCLDMSLLFASCLEAAGLHPLIVIIKGHAFVGAWLVQDTLADPVTDDPSILTKRMAEGIYEIALIEATAMNAGKEFGFEQAEQLAASHMTNVDDFIMCIDIKRARYGGVLPLPIRVQDDKEWKWVPTAMPSKIDSREDLISEIKQGDRLVHTSRITVGRQQIWERKLLDLSLRNALLNMRISQQTLQLITPPLSELEDMLSSGKEMTLLPRPADWDGQLRHSGLYEALHATDPILQLVAHELQHSRIRCYQAEAHFQEVLTGIYRKAKSAMEENGANTLFLAIGVLRWYETPQSQRPRFAPLILTPVEIIRRGAQKGFVLRSRDEESQINITLLEMLRQDFGITVSGLDPLPRDENGVDVKRILHIVRQLIMNQPRWDVETQALIGHFSFSKFVMWRDLHEHAELLSRNPVVDSLIKNQLSWLPEVDSSNESKPDKIWKLTDVLLPIGADSSQLKAIASALTDKSFVLHGPPGTGKSQTITNIIANALYRGKRVLFVAEKMAALEVVEKRLASIGLGPYCLELHSNKARKTAVLEQLKQVLETGRVEDSGVFEQEANRLEALRAELNLYIEELHKPGPFGLSLYDAMDGFKGMPASIEAAPIEKTVIQDADASRRQLIEDQAQAVEAAAQSLREIPKHPLQPVLLQDYSMQVQTEANQLLPGLHDTGGWLMSHAGRLLQSIGLEEQDILRRGQWIHILRFLDIWISGPDFPASLLTVSEPIQTWERIRTVALLGLKYQESVSSLSERFLDSILQVQPEALQLEWQQASQRWWPSRWWQHRKVKRKLQLHAKSGKLSHEEVPILLGQLRLLHDEEKALMSESNWLLPLLGPLWKGVLTDWTRILIGVDVLATSYNQVLLIVTESTQLSKWREKFGALLAEGVNSYAVLQQPFWSEFSQKLTRLLDGEERLKGLLMWKFDSDTPHVKWLSETMQLYKSAHEHLSDLRDWCIYKQQSNQLASIGIAEAVVALNNGHLPASGFADSVKKGVYKAIADYQIETSGVLSKFSSDIYNDSIKRYAKLMKQFEELSRKTIVACVNSKLPNMLHEAARSSEVSILKRAIGNNGRGISIRQLFQQIPHLLPRITPCMLMSPISVAQYLSLDLEPFDLIIFDEASQMPTAEAIGALARGKNVVVVGDPKQMPPTSFFAAQQFDGDNADKEDMESILDDCLALPMPSKHLLWHYRSRHESLIAFSNAKYYDHHLLTFPSADDIETKVGFVPVQGYYDRSKARHNRAEAEAVVAEIVQRLKDPALRMRSLGVVTFSSVQQQLIQDLADAAFAEEPMLEKWAYETEEPLFIKNLENVQGDERDVILFSVGYGPDKDGKLYMNFGPINRDGGWRRLNVAVSRARYEMKVFSTLRGAQIDLTRTSSEGVAGLKAFLEYAEKGKTALPGAMHRVLSHSGNVEMAIADTIRAMGYEVHTSVGTSGFKVDIAVVHPQQKGKYLLGVLCDGKQFAGVPAARDRYIGKVDVLQHLGWRIHSIWVADWWMRSNREIQKLQDAINSAIENAPDNESVAITEELPATESLTVEVAEEQELAAPLLLNKNAEPKSQHQLRQVYKEASLPKVPLNYIDFLAYSQEAFIAQQLETIILTEAPITRRLLYQRVLQAWGIARLGVRIEEQLTSAMERVSCGCLLISNQEIVVPKGFVVKDYLQYRVHDIQSSSVKRNVEDIPIPEIVNAMHDILMHQISLPSEELQRETAKLFGFARMGQNVEQCMKDGLSYGFEIGKLLDRNGRIIAAMS